MYKPSDSPPDREKRRGARLAAMTGLALVAAIGMLLQLPFGATAGIASSDDGRNMSRVPPSTAAPNQKAPGTYQLRCWQYGRLLFDEFQTQDGNYASRIYIVAERVEFLATRKPSNGQASDEASPDQPASDGAAREAHQAA